MAVENHNAEQYNYNDMISYKGIPYGLAIYNDFKYPLEKISVATAYPNFKSWLMGDIDAFPRYNYTSGTVCELIDKLLLWNPQIYYYYWITKH